MATPTTRKEFKEYCLRKLGKPVIEINVDDDQIDDRIDEALKYYWDYHFDGSERLYYKYMIQDGDRRDAIKEVTIVSGGIGYSNSDTIVITRDQSDSTGTGGAASIVTDSAPGAACYSTGNNYGWIRSSLERIQGWIHQDA